MEYDWFVREEAHHAVELDEIERARSEDRKATAICNARLGLRKPHNGDETGRCGACDIKINPARYTVGIITVSR